MGGKMGMRSNLLDLTGSQRSLNAIDWSSAVVSPFLSRSYGFV